ncbi:MAG: hypothetical protein H0U62_04145 [Actinobacteria bacterium]|nr:hypothetical protein [Actinomycetota bacterium]
MSQAAVGPDATTGDSRGTNAFLAVWLPSLVVIIGTGACLFTLSWWVTQSPRGAADLGLVIGLSSMISLVTLTAVSGVLDRADRTRTVARLLLILTVPVAILVAVLGQRPDGVAILLGGICYMLISTGESLYLATSETVAADLAPEKWPSARVALLTQIHSQTERVIAPMLAGPLLAAGAVRAVPMAAVVLILAMLVAILATRGHLDGVTRRTVRAAEADAPTGVLKTVVKDARSAVRLVRAHGDLVFLVQLGILGNLIVFPFYAVLPAYLTEYVTGPQDLATWYARSATAYGVGMLAGTVVLVQVRRNLSGDAALLGASASLAAICLVLIGGSVTSAPHVVVGMMVVNGALFAVMVAVGGAVWLNRTPSTIRVRVFALRRLTVFSSIPVGTMLMGFGGTAVGHRTFVSALAVLVLVLLVTAWLRYRHVARRSAKPLEVS